MAQLVSLWSALDLRRRILVVGASLAMFVTILLLGRMAAAPSMTLLYSGLDSAAAGEVMGVLDARSVPYEVRGSSILVPADQRDSLRLSLAAEGLPAQGGAGYELLDGLSGFGTTTQMFDAAWTRAIEGELTRTILANPQIKAARVHIARGSDRPFAPASDPSASVFVSSVGGLTGDQARALRHLLAAAVTGLRPDRVEVIDRINGLIPIEGAGPVNDGANSRGEAIRRNIERLLAARVGPGRAVVEVAVELVSESELLTERRLDPQGRVIVSSETQTSNGSETLAGGDVTVASNLPDGSAGGDQNGGSRSEESRERLAYELSETRREVTRAPGDIRRLSVAVLVDGEWITAPDGTTTWQERSEQELEDLRELVSSAAGIDDGRGDVLTLKSLQLMAAAEDLDEAASPLSFDLTRVAGLALLAAVILVIALFVLRPALRPSRRIEPALPIGPPGPVDGFGLAPPVLTGEIADGFGLPNMPLVGDDLGHGGFPAVEDDPVNRLRRLIGERREESLEIIRQWMEMDGGRT